MGIGCMGQKAGARDDVGRYEPSIVDYAVPSSNESEWIKDCLLYTSPSPRDS